MKNRKRPGAWRAFEDIGEGVYGEKDGGSAVFMDAATAAVMAAPMPEPSLE